MCIAVDCCQVNFIIYFNLYSMELNVYTKNDSYTGSCKIRENQISSGGFYIENKDKM